MSRIEEHPFQDWIHEYEISDQFLFLNPEIKDRALYILNQFSQGLSSNSGGPSLGSTEIENSVLRVLKSEKLTSPEKKLVPYLVGEFFEYLSTSGKNPLAADWKVFVREMEPALLAQIREDGTVKGKTVINKGSETGRNDPCPCGSGKKFKKCCLPLISG